MNPVTAVNATIAAIDLVEKLLPVIHEMHVSGNVSPEQQAEVMDRLKVLRAGGQFDGPEWEAQK